MAFSVRRLAGGVALAVLLTTGCSSALPIAVAGVAAPVAAPITGRLLFMRNGSVEEITAAGTRVLAQPTLKFGGYMSATWSPDGHQIAYAVRQKNYSDIGLMAADGSNPTLLTHNQNTVVEDNVWAAMPAWSPDGTSLVYISDRGKQEPNIDLRLWQLTLATRAFRQLSVPDVQAGGDADAQFRPGHAGQIVYTKWSYDANATAVHASLVLLDLSTNQSFTLTPPTETDFQPAWSPDGKTLAFIRRGPTSDELYAAPVPDTLASDITVPGTLLNTGINAQPCWSPAGDAIAFLAEKDHQFELFTEAITVDPRIALRGKPEQLTTDGVDATGRPSWTR